MVDYPIHTVPGGKPPGSSLPLLSVHYFTNSWPMLFLNQWKRKNGHVQIFTFTRACARRGVDSVSPMGDCLKSCAIYKCLHGDILCNRGHNLRFLLT